MAITLTENLKSNSTMSHYQIVWVDEDHDEAHTVFVSSSQPMNFLDRLNSEKTFSKNMIIFGIMTAIGLTLLICSGLLAYKMGMKKLKSAMLWNLSVGLGLLLTISGPIGLCWFKGRSFSFSMKAM